MNDFWNKYTDKNKDKDAKGISDFIYHTCLALGATKICELGCNVGNNLESFPTHFNVFGIDINEHAIEMAKKKSVHVFEAQDILNTDFGNNTFDLVFTRGVFIHLPLEQTHLALVELLRISKKYIFHLEYHGKDGTKIKYGVGCWKRNMAEHYKYLPVTILSEVDIPTEIDSDCVRFTLVKKK